MPTLSSILISSPPMSMISFDTTLLSCRKIFVCGTGKFWKIHIKVERLLSGRSTQEIVEGPLLKLIQTFSDGHPASDPPLLLLDSCLYHENELDKSCSISV